MPQGLQGFDPARMYLGVMPILAKRRAERDALEQQRETFRQQQAIASSAIKELLKGKSAEEKRAWMEQNFETLVKFQIDPAALFGAQKAASAQPSGMRALAEAVMRTKLGEPGMGGTAARTYFGGKDILGGMGEGREAMREFSPSAPLGLPPGALLKEGLAAGPQAAASRAISALTQSPLGRVGAAGQRIAGGAARMTSSPAGPPSTGPLPGPMLIKQLAAREALMSPEERRRQHIARLGFDPLGIPAGTFRHLFRK